MNGHFLPAGHSAVVHGGAIGVPVVPLIPSDRALKRDVVGLAWA